MIKVKASVQLRDGQELPTNIELDVPKEYCNRKDWNNFISEVMASLLRDRLKIDFEVMEG